MFFIQINQHVREIQILIVRIFTCRKLLYNLFLQLFVTSRIRDSPAIEGAKKDLNYIFPDRVKSRLSRKAFHLIYHSPSRGSD